MVFLFNPTSAYATCLVNQGAIPPIEPTDTSTGFVPRQVSAAFVRHRDEVVGAFCYGTNELRVTFLDQTGAPGQRHVRLDYSFKLERNISLEDDLIMYVFRDRILLMNHRGMLLDVDFHLLSREQLPLVS